MEQHYSGLIFNPFFIIIMYWNYYLTKADDNLDRWHQLVNVWYIENVKFFLLDLNTELSNKILNHLKQ